MQHAKSIRGTTSLISRADMKRDMINVQDETRSGRIESRVTSGQIDPKIDLGTYT
jgi:hypothetical protein